MSNFINLFKIIFLKTYFKEKKQRSKTVKKNHFFN
jgi:hypothetical protein